MTEPAHPGPRVLVLTVPECHLCAAAVATVSAVCDRLAIGWFEESLFDRGDDEVRKWRDFVPILLVDGAVVDTLRVDASRLEAALER